MSSTLSGTSPFKSTGPSVNGNNEVSYAHGPLATTGDWDDYRFTPSSSGTLEVRLSPGIWTSPRGPAVGVEPNARYGFAILEQSAKRILVCPAGQTLTLQVSVQPSIGLDCLNHPPSLVVGTAYRLRVFHAGPTTLPGHVGRYTVTVRDVTPTPTLPEPIVRFR